MSTPTASSSTSTAHGQRIAVPGLSRWHIARPSGTANSEDDDRADEEHAHASHPSRRMQLELVNVSSTSVSLAVFGPLQGVAHAHGQPGHGHGHGQPHTHHTDTHHSASTSSSAPNHTSVSSRRSRAASTSSERLLAASSSSSQQPPNISIKLNSAAWPHVFHTDAAAFADHDSRSPSGQPEDTTSTSSASNILVWGLSPGQNYHIELGVYEDGVEEDEDTAEAEELSETSDLEEPVRATASVRTLDVAEPDVPPPPYSSHDPSSSSGGTNPHDDAEAALRTMLDKLRLTSKQKESSLQSAIASMRRANDKLTREDQRHRQRIHVLEDSTARLREVAAEEDAEHESMREQIDELEEAEKTLAARIDRRKTQIETVERQSKDETDRDEAELAELKERLDKAAEKEEEVLAKKLQLERELLPTYSMQLATLEADLRRLVDDHRRRFPYQHHLPVHAFSSHLAHAPNVGHLHAHPPAQAAASSQQQVQQVQQQQQTVPARSNSGRASRAPTGQQPIQPGVSSASREARDEVGVVGMARHRQASSPAASPALELPSQMLGRPRSISALQAATSVNANASANASANEGPGEGAEQDSPSGEPSNSNSTSAVQSSSSAAAQPISGVRTSSRFGWSNPNSWASKVASGPRQAGGSPAAATGPVSGRKA